MRAGEARRRLRNIGWRAIHVTADNHDIWEAPNGERRMINLGHASGDIHRSDMAFVIQAERVAAYAARPARLKTNLQENLMATTAVLEPEPIPAPNGTHTEPAPEAPKTAPKAEPKIVVYRGRGTTHSAIFYFGQAEADELGGVGTRISILQEAAGWVMRANPGGMSTLRKASYGTGIFQVSSTAIGKVIKLTARTEILAERGGGGFILYPELVEPVPFVTDAQDVWAKPAKPAPDLRPWHAARQQYAEQRAQTEAAAVAYAERLAQAMTPRQELVPAKHDKPLEELVLALEQVRKLAAELGAELRIDDRGMLRAKLTLEI